MAKKNASAQASDIEPADLGDEGPAAAPEPQAPPADAAALAEENRQLREELAALRAARAQAPAGLVELPADGRPKQRFHVTMKHGPDWVVEAFDEANAAEAYRRTVGIITTEHRIEARPAGEMPVGRVLPVT